MEKIEYVLSNCIKEIRSGKTTLADCLERYPLNRQELEPLINLALNIHEPPETKLDNNYKQITKAQLLQQIMSLRQNRARSFSDILSLGIPVHFGWARVVVSVLVVLILISSLAGGTVYASQNSLPGDMLYSIKTGSEDIRLLIAGSNSDKAKLNFEFARTRLEEMKKLMGSDENKAQIAVNGYRSNLEEARQQLEKISDDVVLSELLVEVLADVQSQAIYCDNIIDTAFGNIALVSEASNMSIDAQIQLIEMLAYQNNIGATQVNVIAMQNRLQRAMDEADKNNYQVMQEALLQYQRFNRIGEQILRNAEASGFHNDEIEALNLQALAGYLDILNNISTQVPTEYQNNINTSRQMTLQFQNQVRNRFQNQGNPYTGAEVPSLDNSDDFAGVQDIQTTSVMQNDTGFTGDGTMDNITPVSSGTEGNADGTNGAGIGEGNGGSSETPAITPSGEAQGNGDGSGNGNQTGKEGPTNTDSGTGSGNGTSSGGGGNNR